MSEPKVSIKTYTFTFVALLGLTLLTSLLGFLNLGKFSLVVAVFIAGMKASLIAGIFMHALYDSKLVRVIVAGGVLWVWIMMGLTLTDYISRGALGVPGK
jgi:cytochrome c oxidase subunit IV